MTLVHDIPESHQTPSCHGNSSAPCNHIRGMPIEGASSSVKPLSCYGRQCGIWSVKRPGSELTVATGCNLYVTANANWYIRGENGPQMRRYRRTGTHRNRWHKQDLVEGVEKDWDLYMFFYTNKLYHPLGTEGRKRSLRKGHEGSEFIFSYNRTWKMKWKGMGKNMIYI